MKFDDKDYRTIKEFALHYFNDKKVRYDKPELFVPMCYTNAVIDFLSANGYEIVKKEENNDVSE